MPIENDGRYTYITYGDTSATSSNASSWWSATDWASAGTFRTYKVRDIYIPTYNRRDLPLLGKIVRFEKQGSYFGSNLDWNVGKVIAVDIRLDETFTLLLSKDFNREVYGIIRNSDDYSKYESRAQDKGWSEGLAWIVSSWVTGKLTKRLVDKYNKYIAQHGTQKINT